MGLGKALFGSITVCMAIAASAQPGGPAPSGYSGPSPMGGPYGAPSGPMQGPVPSRFAPIPPSYGRSSSPMGQPGAIQPPSYGSPYPGVRTPNNPSPADTSGMQQALRRGDYEKVGEEAQQLRSRSQGLDTMAPQLPVQDRLKLPLINHMYNQAAKTLDQGSNSQDPTKVRLGMQQVDEANKRLGRLENEIRSATPNGPASGIERQPRGQQMGGDNSGGNSGRGGHRRH